MRRAKYIIFKSAGVRVAVVFSNQIQHSAMVTPLMEVISAGFVTFEGKWAKCSGESISLNAGSAPGDEKIIERTLFPGV